MNTVSPAELRVILTLTSKAPTTVGEAFDACPVIARLVTLANQEHPIGAIVPKVPSVPPAPPSEPSA